MTTPVSRTRSRADDLPDILNTGEIARFLQVSPATVRALVKSGTIRRLPIGGRHIRVLKEEVMRYLRESMGPLP